MVNEEDHLRVQVIRAGLALDQAAHDADAVDDWIERHLDLAFSPRFGFLTACPTNLGTGLRMSVMMHLPSLRMTGEIDKVKRAAADMNLAVRGYYGEHSDAAGDFYQLSNQVTLGKTESIILRELQQEIIPRVIEYERHARRSLLSARRSFLEDQVFRARGMLASARLLSTEEAMQGLSLLRLGAVAGLLDSPDQKTACQLMLQVQPAHLQRALGVLDQEQRLLSRATLVRQRLGETR
jgi:protein arginine kinase